MTFDARETSIQSGEPRELYDFTVGLVHYRYTSADTDTVYLGEQYESVAIERSEIEESDEISRSDLQMTVPRDLPIADLFRVAPPSEVVLLNLYRIHVGDPERKLVWSGRLLNVTWEGVRAVIVAESIYTSLRRPGLRRSYGRACPHVLFGTACGVNELAYKLTKTVIAVSGTTVTFGVNELALLGDGYLAGGMLEFEESPGVYVRRAIRSHTGDAITITHPIATLVNTSQVDLYPGCDHSLATCQSKYGNAVNYGGFPFIPRINPFGGGSIF